MRTNERGSVVRLPPGCAAVTEQSACQRPPALILGGARATVESSVTAEEVFMERRAGIASASNRASAIALAPRQAHQMRLLDFVSKQFP